MVFDFTTGNYLGLLKYLVLLYMITFLFIIQDKSEEFIHSVSI